MPCRGGDCVIVALKKTSATVKLPCNSSVNYILPTMYLVEWLRRWRKLAAPAVETITAAKHPSCLR